MNHEDVSLDIEDGSIIRRKPAAIRGWLRSGQATGYLMVAPAIIFLLVIIVYPLLNVFRLSFYEFAGLREQTATFNGLNNYISLLSDKVYLTSLKNTLVFVMGGVIGHTVVGLLFALALHQNWPSNWLRNFVRGLLILPWLFSLAAAGLVWALIFNPLGPLNYLLVSTGLVEEAVNFLGQRETALWSLITVNIWKNYPFYMIMLLGGLQTIPPELYSAAKVDGAGRWGRFRHITLPLLRPVLVATSAIDFITSFGHFDLIRTLTEGGPARSTITLGYYTWLVGFRDVDFGYGSAISISMLLLTSVALIIYLRLSKEGIYG